MQYVQICFIFVQVVVVGCFAFFFFCSLLFDAHRSLLGLYNSCILRCFAFNVDRLTIDMDSLVFACIHNVYTSSKNEIHESTRKRASSISENVMQSSKFLYVLKKKKKRKNGENRLNGYLYEISAHPTHASRNEKPEQDVN